ncbi:hypothetical protein [Halalkalibaculum sp. DA384]|uniref:hypothetical protein n=1 Tax=Halalkalibaculum sp. DA384 TaxID=3373606 RepID=UPI003754F275
MEFKNTQNYIIAVLLILIMTSCEGRVTDFGYNASISGQVLDQSGNIVSGDITSASFSVQALGEQDELPMELRINGDGTYANTKLYPQSYTVWLEGPIISSQEITVDLSDGGDVTHDFTVTPFLTIPPPELNSSATSSEVSVSYSVRENEGHVAELIEVYVSTVAYPTHTTGSGTGWHTQTEEMNENEGTVTVSGLEPGTQYFIRIGARAEDANTRNFSDQITVTTPES